MKGQRMAEILFKEESYKIVGACFEVYNEKGCGAIKGDGGCFLIGAVVVIETDAASNQQVTVRFDVELIAGRIRERHGVAGLRPRAIDRVDVVIGNSSQVTDHIVTVNKFAEALIDASFPRFAGRPLERVLFISGHASVTVG